MACSYILSSSCVCVCARAHAHVSTQSVMYSSGDLPNPGVELASLVSPALADGFFTNVPPGKSILSKKSGNLK